MSPLTSREVHFITQSLEERGVSKGAYSVKQLSPRTFIVEAPQLDFPWMYKRARAGPTGRARGMPRIRAYAERMNFKPLGNALSVDSDSVEEARALRVLEKIGVSGDTYRVPHVIAESPYLDGFLAEGTRGLTAKRLLVMELLGWRPSGRPEAFRELLEGTSRFLLACEKAQSGQMDLQGLAEQHRPLLDDLRVKRSLRDLLDETLRQYEGEVPTVASHGELGPRNLLVSDLEGKPMLWVVDWEGAFWGYADFDFHFWMFSVRLWSYLSPTARVVRRALEDVCAAHRAAASLRSPRRARTFDLTRLLFLLGHIWMLETQSHGLRERAFRHIAMLQAERELLEVLERLTAVRP